MRGCRSTRVTILLSGEIRTVITEMHHVFTHKWIDIQTQLICESTHRHHPSYKNDQCTCMFTRKPWSNVPNCGSECYCHRSTRFGLQFYTFRDLSLRYVNHCVMNTHLTIRGILLQDYTPCFLHILCVSLYYLFSMNRTNDSDIRDTLT